MGKCRDEIRFFGGQAKIALAKAAILGAPRQCSRAPRQKRHLYLDTDAILKKGTKAKIALEEGQFWRALRQNPGAPRQIA